MPRSQISQLIQMRPIGIPDTTSADLPAIPRKTRHPEEET